MMIWMLFKTEIFFMLTAGVFLYLSLIPKPDSRRDYTAALALSGLGIGVALLGVAQAGDLFDGAYRVDMFSQVFKALLAMGYFLVICLCSELKGVSERRHPEFYFLLTICTLSMMILVSSVHLLAVYIALELSSYSLYILVCLRKDHDGSLPSAVRYFFIGASASALMLLGMALLYSAANTAYLIELVRLVPEMMNRPLVAVGLLLTLSGFFFKLAVFPFHFWAPEAYYGAPNQASAYIATASKVAAIAVLIRIVALSGGQSQYLVNVLLCVSIVSMTAGNLTAIVQKDLKKLLAYSSIAHAGYVLIGVLSMSPAGYSGAVFYALTILVLKFTCFFVIIKVAAEGRNPVMGDLAGLHKRSPILAMALMLALFGLAGIPPTIGFTGKLLLFTAAIEKGHFALVVIAMINVVISLYYYLLVLKAAFLSEPGPHEGEMNVTAPTKAMAAVMSTVIIMVGFYPEYFIKIAKTAINVLQ
jgi:NADH-quinone oxidoreductase subunit N